MILECGCCLRLRKWGVDLEGLYEEKLVLRDRLNIFISRSLFWGRC